MRSFKAAACLLAAASLCGALAAAAPAQTARAAKYEAEPATGAGVRWADVRVEFEGNRFFTSEQLRRATAECYAGHSRDEEKFKPDLLDYCLRKDLVGLMRRAGYLRAKFGEARTLQLGPGLSVFVPVEENELYRLGSVKIEGAEHFKAERLRELLPSKEGDIADGDAIAVWVYEHLRKKYADEGFIQYESEIEPEFRLEPGATEGVADIAVTIYEGKRFKLRRVEFEGAAGAPLDALREALGLKQGEVFRQREYEDGFEKLNGLELFRAEGRFENVDRDRDVDFRADEESGEVDLTIHLREKGQERVTRRAAR